LTPDLVQTYDHSTQLSEFRVIIFAAGAILSVGCQSFLIDAFPYNDTISIPNQTKGYSIGSLLLGVLFGLFALTCGIFIKERVFTREEHAASIQHGIWKNIQDLIFTLKSRSFICVLISYFLSWTSVQLLQNNLVLYVKYVVAKEDQFMYIVLCVLGFAAPAAFFWSKVTVWAGKRNTMIASLLQFSLILLSLFFIGPTTPIWIMYVIAVFGGVGIGQAMVVPWSTIPDIIDEDERDRGVRREGAFYSIFVLFQKIGLATALSLTSWVLGAAGYIAPDENDLAPPKQAPEVLLVLKVIAGPLPAAVVFVSTIPLLFYKLDRKAVEGIIEELDERKKLLDGETTS